MFCWYIISQHKTKKKKKKKKNMSHCSWPAAVEDPVLHDRHDALRLHALHVRGGQRGAEVGVVAAEVFEGAATACHALHLHAGAQDHVGALAPELLAHGGGPVLHGDGVPGGGHGQHGRPHGGGARDVAPVGPEAIRGVLHVEAREAQLGHGRRIAHLAISHIVGWIMETDTYIRK